MLQKTFIDLLSNYTSSENLQLDFWNEIENSYSYEKRYYHNLQHFENLLNELFKVKNEIDNWEAVLFSLYFHDIIYDVLSSENEEKSTELAVNRMLQVSVPNEQIELCKKIIIATKSHDKSTNNDINLFIDADLSILGQSFEIYSIYSKNVRKEFDCYPDSIYNTGRKKVLNHFLEMERIFKTDYFYNKFEKQAKNNLLTELNSLQK